MTEEYIYRFASDHGCTAGICDAEPLEEERERLESCKTPFVSRDIDKRLNPRRSLPGAKSVIVFGKGYTPSPYKNLSSLGTCRDYHDILTEILNKLAETLDGNYLVMVDSGPLYEKGFAVKAGLGVRAKNGMIASPRWGTFFNLGLLISDLQILPSENNDGEPNIVTGYCSENCLLCAKACPNNAIGDSLRCASYITQKKGIFSDEDKELLSGQLYGCDLCQICCPINNHKPPSLWINPAEIIDMDENGFNKRFGHTGAAWRGLNHLKRNANSGLCPANKGDNNGTVEHKRT